MTRRTVCGLLASAALKAAVSQNQRRIALIVRPTTVRLETGEVSYRFSQQDGLWAFDSVWVRGKKTALPLSRGDSFFLGGGEAKEFAVVTNSSGQKAIRFTGLNGAETVFGVELDCPLPRISVEIKGASAPVCAWRTATTARDQRGAWATRGETGTDSEGREVFIDGSGRLIFGHSRAGDLDAAYVLQAEVNANIHPRGKTMQPSNTFFQSGRRSTPDGFFGFWQIRIGPEQPKRFGIVFDRDLGGRMHHVCGQYYAAAVDSQVDLASVANSYDPYLALERMPLRLSCPESLIPGYGWHMEEYFPGYAKASYPYGEDSGIQTAAFLAYEGHATRRDWEKYFGEYVMSQLPLWGEADGKGFFTRRPGGWTRWAYNTDYVTVFPLMEGGNWTDSEHIYRAAVLFGNTELKEHALGLMRHDVLVKLDLEQMRFPPCWNPLTGKLQDHRDDWETTAALGYCAEISSEVLYRETQDEKFLQIADRITDWLAAQWGPEVRMNYLHPKVNTFHCFMGPLVRALVHRYERSHDPKFLEIAQDLTWVMILTLGTTAQKDPAGRSFTGVTCVGVRGCVDYDCAPNLCHEKDLPFLEIMGALLPHVNGSGYAKFLAMQRIVLPRDSWKDAFHIQEQRDLNLRTNYDNYARGMANLAFALNRGSDPLVAIYERLIPARHPQVRNRRDIVIANGTSTDRETRVQARFLEPGKYSVELDGRPLPAMSAEELNKGVRVPVPANRMRRLRVNAQSLHPTPVLSSHYDASITYISDYPEAGAQRGIGLPTPIFQKDRSFHGGPITLNGVRFQKGLGLAANTVIVYQLNGRFRTFAAAFGVAEDARVSESSKPSVFFTVHVDGRCKFTSGPTYLETPVHQIEVDVQQAQTLVLRMSGNWDDNGNLQNDFGNLGDARLVGKAVL